MATYTTNYNLEKPEASDPFGDFRQSYNGNLDIIDANLGGGGGSSSLAGLSDVNLVTPTNGQILTYDGNSSKWVNANGGGGGGDTVSWTQVQQSGTKIAEIDINGTSQDVYAPSGGGGGDYYYPIIYSDTERKVGVWRDNKPLYQITISIDNPAKQTSGGRYYYQGLYNSNVLDYVQVVSVAVYDAYYGRWYTLPYDRVNGNESIDFFATTNASGFALSAHFLTSAPAYDITKLRYTIQYTKTTDVAGSGNWNAEGVPTVHYSTTEQVVGTWLGKPLYQQTIPFSGLNFTGNVDYPFDVSSYAVNAERIFLMHDMSFYIVSNVQRSFIYSMSSPVQSTYVMLRTEVNRNNASGYVTIRYTKTTD